MKTVEINGLAYGVPVLTVKADSESVPRILIESGWPERMLFTPLFIGLLLAGPGPAATLDQATRRIDFHVANGAASYQLAAAPLDYAGSAYLPGVLLDSARILEPA